MEINTEVASLELREIVNHFKKVGFPEEIPFKEMVKELDNNQRHFLSSVIEVAEKEKRIGTEPEKCIPGDELWNTRKELRLKLQESIQLGLFPLGIIQRNAVIYGAIPDPEEDWKYFRLPNLDYACWKCGNDVLVKDQTISIHDGPFTLSGSGKTRSKKVPYCPNCEQEPPEHDIEKESFYEQKNY